MSPFYYQVKIQVAPDILSDYLSWLKVHIDEMLALGLFEEASIFKAQSIGDPEAQESLTVFYAYRQEQNLQTYLKEYAPRMRSSMPENFQGKLHFERYQLTGVSVE
ncbi:MAG: DUF4286 family protein [Bdellovibrionales bacterium]|nr:DUF4286 family protein [Bdellovibrionales bacterium]